MRRIPFNLHLALGCWLLAFCCWLTAADVSAEPDDRQKKQALLDSGAMPDALPNSLWPQQPLPSEEETVHQTLHFIGTSTRQGIDVSHYQGKIDWHKVAMTGEVSYVFIKATEGGTLVDDCYRTNLAGARRAGLKVGIYHFFSPTVPVSQQLANLFSNVNKKEIDLIPIIDVEHRGKLSQKEFNLRLKDFLKQVERHYRARPIIYTGQNFYNKWLSGTFSKYKFMIAKYDTEIPYLVDDVPFVMWQYTATGRINGIRGNVDRSRFMDNYDLSDILLK